MKRIICEIILVTCNLCFLILRWQEFSQEIIKIITSAGWYALNCIKTTIKHR